MSENRKLPFVIGSVVKVKTGSVHMVVTDLDLDHETATIYWWNPITATISVKDDVPWIVLIKSSDAKEIK